MQRSHRLFYLLSILTSLLLFSIISFAQSQNAVLNGAVTDATGGGLAGAAVTATSVERQTATTVQTDDQGRYSFPNLTPGNYDLSVEAKGFNSYVQKGILLLVNQTVTLPITLAVGDTSTKIEVTAEAAQLNYDNGSQQEGVPPTVINQLPLLVSGGTPRNAVQFITFLPGVNTGTSQQAFNARINGGLKMGDEAIMDGVSMQEGTMSQSGMVAFNDFPTTPDMVSEVRVLTSSYEPEYGTTTGGELIVTTKSGTDQFHGGVFEYLRNKDLNAVQFTNNRPAGDARPKDTENEWGGDIGGPVKLKFIPFIWGDKHKTYFFHDEEYLRATGGTTRPVYSIPTSQERTGNFSDLGVPIYDPTTQAIVNGVINRSPYPGNMIPVSEQSKLAQQWMQYLPATSSSGPYNNYLGTPVPNGILGSTDLFLYKIDHNWGEKDHVYVTIWRQKNPPNNQCALPVQLCNSSPANPEDAWVNRLNWDHIFTPTFLSHFAFGYLNRNEGYGSVPGQDPTKLPQIPNAASYNASPAAQFTAPGISNFYTWGNSSGLGALNKTTRPTYVTNELITLVRGAHTIKFGGEYRHIQQVFRQNGNQSGTVSFSALSTALPGVASGDPYASLYIGAVDSGSLKVYNISKYGAEQRAYSLHVGDTWKMSSKLTINYGLRWDLFTPTWESSNQLSFFSFAPNPYAGNLLGSLAFAGNKWGAASAGVKYPENLFKGAFAPRFGLAYALAKDTVIRAGYGIFYTQAFYPNWGGGQSLDGFNPNVSFGDSLAGYNPAFYLDSGFPAYSKAEDITAGADNGKSPTYRPAYANHLSNTQQWNFTVERKIGGSAIASIAYVASRGTHLPSQLQPLNYLNPSLLTTMGSAELNTVFQPGQASLYGVSVPYAGWVQQLNTAGTCKPTVAQALVQFPQFCGGLFGLNENEGVSFYNSLQTKIEKQFSTGLYLGANYTYSRLMTNASSTTQALAGYGGIGAVITPLQRNRDYTLSTDDIPNSFSLLGAYDLPFGNGRKWLNQSGPLNYVVGGWRLSSSIKLTSGAPLYFRDSNVCGVPSQFEAECIPAILNSSQVLAQSYGNLNVNKPLYSASAFESASLFASGNYLGTGPRVSSIRSSPYRDTNLSVAKTFPIKERVNLEVRAEMFNLFNNHYFTCDGQAFGDCIPFNNDPSSPNFGVWQGTVTQPRNIQLVGRITF